MNTSTTLHRRPDQWLGRTLGKYEISEVLGVGPRGLVFRAHDTSIGRDVAIKILTEQLSADKQQQARFLAGAKSAGKFNHVNTVTVHEVQQDGDCIFLVMEVVSGGNANDHLEKDGPYSVAEATRIVIDASKGLSAAHEVGFVHRDINPSNLLLAEDGTVKVSDFRFAKQTFEPNAQNLTLEGQVIGTPHFMSPEQCEGLDVDARSDVYSLGATYYSLLTGKRPYDDKKNDFQVLMAHREASRPDPRDIKPDVPDVCSQVIEQAMATEPDQRHQSMEELRNDLEAVAEAMAWGYE